MRPPTLRREKIFPIIITTIAMHPAITTIIIKIHPITAPRITAVVIMVVTMAEDTAAVSTAAAAITERSSIANRISQILLRQPPFQQGLRHRRRHQIHDDEHGK